MRIAAADIAMNVRQRARVGFRATELLRGDEP
jgi:hypothetical protein